MLNYDEEIREAQRHLSLITVAINKFIKLNSTGKNEKLIEKQSRQFDKVRMDSQKNKLKISKYIEKIRKDFQKTHIYSYNADGVLDALYNDTREFTYKEIDKIKDIFYHNRKFDDALVALFRAYSETVAKIENLKNRKEYDAKMEAERQKKWEEERIERNKPKPTEEELRSQRDRENAERCERNTNECAEKLLNGPKSSFMDKLSGKDTMLNDMEYLYGLAIDILLLMNEDQNVKIRRVTHGEDSHVYDAYLGYITDKKMKTQTILKSYGVNSVDELLNKYENIRNKYYKNFSKLSHDKAEKYKLENFKSFDIKSNVSDGMNNLIHALINEKMEFPPSKAKLISLMNQRIMNGSRFERCHPEASKEVTANPEDYQKYINVKNYYKNLTKNMDEYEIKSFYYIVVNDLENSLSYAELTSKENLSYYVLMQKLFCELIFERKDMKYSDAKQFNDALEVIAKEVLGEELKAKQSTGEVTEELIDKRKETIEQEYIKYRVKLNLEGKEEPLNFREFANQKYNLKNIPESSNLEELIKEEMRGIKK